MHSVSPSAQQRSALPPHARAGTRMSSLVEAYRDAFDGVPVHTPALLRAAHRLRYQVFCVENAIFDPAKNPDGLERDAYDEHSMHAVLLHRATKAVVGTVRLVLHKPGAPHGSLLFHEICRHPRLHEPDFLPLETTGEIGRFAISKALRPRSETDERGNKLGQFCPPQEFAADPHRLLPQMTLGLIRVALQMCIAQRIRDVCAVMEPSLLRLLARFGLHFAPLGPPVDYYGLRQPCYQNLVELFARARIEQPEVWAVMTDHGRLLGPRQNGEAGREEAVQSALAPTARRHGRLRPATGEGLLNSPMGAPA